MRLLVIEDNIALAQLLTERLARGGFTADVAHTGADALRMADAADYTAVTLDLGLPDMDGLDVLRVLRRRHSAVPVLVLSGRSEVGERVTGLDAGADDYVTKPFDLDEVSARVAVLARRRSREGGGRVLRVGNLTLCLRGRQVAVDGEPQMMSSQELSLLELLMRSRGRVLPKRFIEDQLYSMATEVGPNALEAAVHRLRKWLRAAGAAVEIHTVRGVGYMLAGAPTRSDGERRRDGEERPGWRPADRGIPGRGI